MALVLIELPRPCCREGEPFPLPPRLKGAEHRRTGDGHQARKHQTENGKPGIAGNQVVTRNPAAIANLGSSTAHLHPSNQTTPPGRLRRRAPPPPNPQGITGFNLGTEGKGWEEGISTVPSRRGAAPEGLATAVVGATNQGFLPVPTNTTATSYQQTGNEAPALAPVVSGLEERGETIFRSEVRGPPEQPTDHAPCPPSIAARAAEDEDPHPRARLPPCQIRGRHPGCLGPPRR